MSKDPISLQVADLSLFARMLNRQLAKEAIPPSHVEMLNHLARAGGFRNYQHLRAAQSAKARLATPPEPAADFKVVEKVLHQFDAQGRLLRWPAKRTVQELALWALWATLPAEVDLEERDVNGALNLMHLFDDAAILRRSLVGLGLLRRETDGSAYRRLEKRPSPEAQAVIRLLADRRK